MKFEEEHNEMATTYNNVIAVLEPESVEKPFTYPTPSYLIAG